MKYIILLFLGFQFFSLKAQLPTNETGKISYNEVVIVDSASRDVLLDKAKEWFAIKYKSAKDVIQFDNKSKIIGKGFFSLIFSGYDPDIYHTIIIECKDGRYRYEITDFRYEDKQGRKYPLETALAVWKKGQEKLYNKVDLEVKQIIKSIKGSMIGGAKKDDW